MQVRRIDSKMVTTAHRKKPVTASQQPEQFRQRSGYLSTYWSWFNSPLQDTLRKTLTNSSFQKCFFNFLKAYSQLLTILFCEEAAAASTNSDDKKSPGPDGAAAHSNFKVFSMPSEGVHPQHPSSSARLARNRTAEDVVTYYYTAATYAVKVSQASGSNFPWQLKEQISSELDSVGRPSFSSKESVVSSGPVNATPCSSGQSWPQPNDDADATCSVRGLAQQHSGLVSEVCCDSGPHDSQDLGNALFWERSGWFWQSEEDIVPSLFICPLTHTLMTEPVRASDGNTYERAAILAWFDSGQRGSPVTHQLMHNQVLVPNIRLREAIQHWKIVFMSG